LPTLHEISSEIDRQGGDDNKGLVRGQSAIIEAIHK
jgi:hypothetical protein